MPTYVPIPGDELRSFAMSGEITMVTPLEVCVRRPDGSFRWVPKHRLSWDRHHETWDVE